MPVRGRAAVAAAAAVLGVAAVACSGPAGGVGGTTAGSTTAARTTAPTTEAPTTAAPTTSAPTSQTTQPTSPSPPATSPAVPPVTTQAKPGWALDRIDQRDLPLDGRYRSRAAGAGVTAYVVDCGMQTVNPQFAGRASVGANVAGGSWTDCVDEFGVGHATFVGGIVGGRTTGVAKRVQIVSVRALTGGEGVGQATQAAQLRNVVRAIDWVIADASRIQAPAVVNLSLNFDRPTAALGAALGKAMARLEAAGIPAVVAAGNFDGDACSHPPADAPTALVVAASTRQDRAWVGSNRGRCIDLFAPGLAVRSVLGGDGAITYSESGATSWATPYVTGAVALYLSRHPTATPAAVRRWVVANATTARLRGLPPRTVNRLLYAFAPL